MSLGSARYRSRFCNFGVWCNANIRVLGTRGDSSTLSSPTKIIAPVAQMEECDASNVEVAGSSPARSSNVAQVANLRVLTIDLTPQKAGIIQNLHRAKERKLTTCATRCISRVEIPPRASKINLRSSSSWTERSSHKREGAGSNPASATKS